MAKSKCDACGDTGLVGVYLGDGDFGFHPCEWCSVYNNQHRPKSLAPDRAKRAAKSKPSASKRSKSGAAGKANR